MSQGEQASGTVVWAVIVTHNRLEMLRECLDAVAGQRRRPERVLVVDNASTDGTAGAVRREHPDVELLSLSQNEGGAGGFFAGIERAHSQGADWLWLLDDDTIGEPEALSELVACSAPIDGLPPATLLASRVVWCDGTVHPMNFPTLERTNVERVIAAVEHGVMPIRAATFTSLLVHRSVIDRYGLPLKHFFLWSDDIEYTSRAVLAGEFAYLVPSSVVVHRTAAVEDFRVARPERFYLHARNTLFMVRAPGRPPRDRVLRVWSFLSTSVAYVLRNRSCASVAAVFRALRDGLRPLR